MNMSESDNLTYSSIYKESKDLSIPDDVKNELSKLSKEGTVLSIYATNARALYFFPVNSDVLRITISIYPLTPEIVATIMTKISEFAKKVIYSTGLCLVENKCYWEGFFQERDLNKSIDDIKLALSDIPEIKEILIEKVKTV